MRIVGKAQGCMGDNGIMAENGELWEYKIVRENGIMGKSGNYRREWRLMGEVGNYGRMEL